MAFPQAGSPGQAPGPYAYRASWPNQPPASPYVAHAGGQTSPLPVSANPSFDSNSLSGITESAKAFLKQEADKGCKDSLKLLQDKFPSEVKKVVYDVDDPNDTTPAAKFARRFGKGKGVWDGRRYWKEPDDRVFKAPWGIRMELMYGRQVMVMYAGSGPVWFIHKNIIADTRC